MSKAFAVVGSSGQRGVFSGRVSGARFSCLWLKMAACRRVQLLLLLMSLCLLTVQALKPLPGFGNVHPPAAPMHQQFRAALPNPGNNAAAASSGAQSRRSTGWKLAEEQACRDDVTRLCPKHTWTNNLSVLECLQDKKEVSSTPNDVVDDDECI